MEQNKKGIVLPFQKGTQYTKEDFNSFEKGSRIPELVKEEKDYHLFSSELGIQYYLNTQASKRKERKNYLFLPQTKYEQEAAERNSFLQFLQIKPNALVFATKLKIWIYYVIVILGILAEYIIYQSIFENAFGMPVIKAYLSGFLVLLFTKFVQLSLQNHIKHWVKENNIKYRTIFKTILYVFIVLILTNAVFMGITNINEIEQQKKIADAEFVALSIADAEEFGEDVTELLAEQKQLESELNEDESLFFTIGKYLSIGLIGLLAIGAGAILFAMADLYQDALRLKARIQKLKDRHAELQANFEYFLTTYDELISLQREIVQLFGEKQFLEKLLSKQQETALKTPSEDS